MMTAYSIDTPAHLHHFGFQQNPFPVAPDDANFYLSETIEEIIAEIVHGITARKGFIMLTGDVGLGKTTITRRILRILESKEVRTSLVFHTSLKDVDLLREINRDFGLSVDSSDDGAHLGDQLRRLNDFLVAQYGQGKNCTIIIDDAQNLDRDSLELVRMISNLEVDQQKIVQILLVGQTELMTTLASRAMRQLYSRIVIRKVVRCLSYAELRSYIQFKLNTAGNHGRITLTPFAYWRLYRLSRGNFRNVNMLMDRCLYAICSKSCHQINGRTVAAAATDLYPEREQRRKRGLAWAASILIPLAIVAVSWSVHLQTTRQTFASAIDPGRRYKVPEIPKADVTAMVVPGADSASDILHTDATASRINPAVAEFLQIYQLDRYANDFQIAIERGTLGSLSIRIYGESGFQLIRLVNVPDYIRRKYGALAFSIRKDRPPVWLLFWRPEMELRRFYYDYRGEEIYALQKKLKALNFYRYRVDGIVGRRLMNAVIDFQKSAGLPMTGFPDPATLFWVCHSQTEVSNG